jgi:hypothetical protein
MDQPIPFYKPNKKMSSEKIDQLILQTKLPNTTWTVPINNSFDFLH